VGPDSFDVALLVEALGEMRRFMAEMYTVSRKISLTEALSLSWRILMVYCTSWDRTG